MASCPRGPTCCLAPSACSRIFCSRSSPGRRSWPHPRSRVRPLATLQEPTRGDGRKGDLDGRAVASMRSPYDLRSIGIAAHRYLDRIAQWQRTRPPRGGTSPKWAILFQHFSLSARQHAPCRALVSTSGLWASGLREFLLGYVVLSVLGCLGSSKSLEVSGRVNRSIVQSASTCARLRS
jgi:hypothetical protein